MLLYIKIINGSLLIVLRARPWRFKHLRNNLRIKSLSHPSIIYLILVPETRKFHLKAILQVLIYKALYISTCSIALRGVPTFSVWYRACLSGTARVCLVQAVWHSLLFIYVSNYDVTTQKRNDSRDVRGFPWRKREHFWHVSL